MLENTPDNRRHVISILDAANGDVEASKTAVIRDKFRTTIWNEMAQAATEDGSSIDNDIYQRTTKHLNEELAKRLVDATESREVRRRALEGNRCVVLYFCLFTCLCGSSSEVTNYLFNRVADLND